SVHPVHVIVTDPAFGPVISPASVLAAQITRLPLTALSRLCPLDDVNVFPNGALNSGSAALDDCAVAAPSASRSVAHRPASRIRFMLIPPWRTPARRSSRVCERPYPTRGADCQPSVRDRLAPRGVRTRLLRDSRWRPAGRARAARRGARARVAVLPRAHAHPGFPRDAVPGGRRAAPQIQPHLRPVRRARVWGGGDEPHPDRERHLPRDPARPDHHRQGGG